jgi:tetratricopeptide (TPR) repeat protein
MSDDIKIGKIKMFLALGDLSATQESDMIDLALSISDQDDKDLALEEIAVMLANRGKYDRAYEVLNKITLGYERAEGNTKVAYLLASSGRKEESLKFLQNAETAALQARRHWQVAELLHDIANCFVSIYERDEAIRILNQAISFAQEGEITGDAQDSMDSSSVLVDISLALAKIGEKDRAYDVAFSIKNSGKRKRAIDWLTVNLPKSQN